MQDLTDADKSDANVVELPETVETVVAVEISEVAGAERAETAQEVLTGNNEDAPIDTIQVSCRKVCASRFASGVKNSPFSSRLHHITFPRTCKKRSTSFWRRFVPRARPPSGGRPPRRRRWRRRSLWSGRSWKVTPNRI